MRIRDIEIEVEFVDKGFYRMVVTDVDYWRFGWERRDGMVIYYDYGPWVWRKKWNGGKLKEEGV